jgi:PTH1 family peptidyl-tRNA hydrolase
VDAALIVGLGNPGAGYRTSRHNLGFVVAEEVASALGARFADGPGAFLQARAHEGGSPVVIVKPLTYMNLSGSAVAEAMTWTGIPPERTLIVLDDFQLPLGTLRMRPAGSDGGHKGLGSVIVALGTDAVPRLRCGIGREVLPPKEERRAFVLEPFDEGEIVAVREMIVRGAEAARAFALSGIQQAMTVYNTP